MFLFYEELEFNLFLEIGEIKYSDAENHHSFMDFNESSVHYLRISIPYSNNLWFKETFLHQNLS